MPTTTWTPGMISKMKTLLARGLSMMEIGKQIGMSKNAVVGKINRMGLSANASAKSAKPAPKKPSATTPARKILADKKRAHTEPAKPAKPVVRPIVKTAPSKRAMAMHQRIIQHSMEMATLRPDQCRWPIGNPDGDGFHFCGETVFPGKPYCYEHCKQAYQFVQPKKKG